MERLVEYISKYFGPVMHVDTSKFALAVGLGDIVEIENAYKELCNTIVTEHAYHHEEINKHFNRMRTQVSMYFGNKDTRPPSLPYVFFGNDLPVDDCKYKHVV
jgi:hypothetical protein